MLIVKRNDREKTKTPGIPSIKMNLVSSIIESKSNFDFKKSKECSKNFFAVFQSGLTLHGKQIETQIFEEAFLKFLVQLGIRQINKFCKVH